MIFLFALALAAPPAPDCSVAPGFTQHGAARTYEADNLFDYMDGNAEGYLLYSFTQMKGVTCVKGDARLIIDYSEFADTEMAYGMFMANVDNRQPQTKLGTAGQALPRKAVFVKDKYYLEVAAEHEGDHTALLTAVCQAIEKKIPGATSLPAELQWFPTEGRQPGFPRLVPQSVLGLRMLRKGYVANYPNGKAFIVTEADAAAATALLAKLKERFAEPQPVKLGDEAVKADDRLFGRVCVFRKGSRVAGWVQAPADADPAALAAKLAGVMP